MLTFTNPLQVVPEKIMQETLNDHPSIFIGGTPICNLQFTNDIDLTGGSNGKLQDLTKKLVDSATAYRTEVKTEKREVMTDSMSNISADISMNSQK